MAQHAIASPLQHQFDAVLALSPSGTINQNDLERDVPPTSSSLLKASLLDSMRHEPSQSPGGGFCFNSVTRASRAAEKL